MSRVSKVRNLGLEKEVLELRQKGFGAVTISKKLNELHKLEGPHSLHFNNITNFLNSVPRETMIALKEEHIEEVYIEPLRQLKSDLSDLRGPLFEKAKAILNKKEEVLKREEINSLEVYLRHYEDVWDRIAKIENLLKPEETIRAKNIFILQQYNQVKGLIDEVISTCENCRQHFLGKLQTLVESNAPMQ